MSPFNSSREESESSPRNAFAMELAETKTISSVGGATEPLNEVHSHTCRENEETRTVLGPSQVTQSRIDADSVDRHDPGSPSEPAIFGEYELLREIARGGMGVVYLARHRRLGRVVALKRIIGGALADASALRRFEIEAEAAARLDHPNIVPIFDVGQVSGQPYFTMAFVDGGSLASRLSDGPLPTMEAAKMITSLADAVHYAHRQGVVHRDLKPGNVLLDADGEPRITDFGLAKRVDDIAGQTASGELLGTPSYMPPEQASGKNRNIGPPADVYALGAVLYALMTGKPPFVGDSVMGVLIQVLESEPIPPRSVNASIDRDLETICLKALQKDPLKRYETAKALADDVRRFMAGEPIRARPVSGVERAVRWTKRHPIVASLMGVIVLLLTMSFWTLKQGLASLETIAFQNLQHVAEGVSERVHDRLRNNSGVIAVLSREDEVIDVFRGTGEDHPAQKAEASRLLRSIVTFNPDFELAFLLSPDGRVILSSLEQISVGQSYAHRTYFREAIAGRETLSGMMVGSMTGRPGMFFATPVRDEYEQIVGVAVLKLRQSIVQDIVDHVHLGGNTRAFIIDETGVVIAHHDPSKILASVLPPSVRGDESLQERLSSQPLIRLGDPMLTELWEKRYAAGHLKYTSLDDGRVRVLGYAPVKDRGWVTAVEIDASEFDAPFTLLLREYGAALAVVLTLIVVILLAVQRPSLPRMIRRWSGGSTTSLAAS